MVENTSPVEAVVPLWLIPVLHLSGDGGNAASPGVFRESGAGEEGHPAAALL